MCVQRTLMIFQITRFPDNYFKPRKPPKLDSGAVFPIPCRSP